MHTDIYMERRALRRPQRVLIADDSQDMRDLWRMWLTIWGFQVEEACNGFEAVQKALVRAPDLVLMDLWMPVMDGLRATAQLRARRSTAGIPILALSAHVFPPAPQEAVAVGCDRFLPKPVEPDVLLDEIRQALGRVRVQQAADHQMADCRATDCQATLP